MGMPIVCPDLPYARAICGDNAVYFDPHDAKSLERGVVELFRRASSGWSPDWSSQLALLPKNWPEVARTLFAIANGR